MVPMHLIRSIVRALVPATAAVAIVYAAACSDANGPNGKANANLTLNVATLSASSIADLVGARAMAPSFDRHITTPGGAHVLVITRAAVSFSRLELAATDSAACDDDANDDDANDNDGRLVAAEEHGSDDGNGADDRCEQLETGPMLVELPVDNSVVSMLSLQIPAGTYAGLEARIHTVQRSDSGGTAFLASHPEFANASVRVEGTFDGHPFNYTGTSNARLELHFDPPLAVGSTPTNLTVHVSIDRWFTDRNGALIDPSTANGNGDNASLVADNIQRSFHAFEDHDRHGDDGHGDDGFDDGQQHDGGDH
jgi:hypothetical protein